MGKGCEQPACFPHGNSTLSAAQGHHGTGCTKVMLTLSYLIAGAAFGGKKLAQVTGSAGRLTFAGLEWGWRWRLL